MENKERPDSGRLNELAVMARRIRATCVRMAFDGKEGHLTSALSCVDILVSLYNEWLRVDPTDIDDPHRDRLLFSKGHAASALYSVLAERGFIDVQMLAQYAKPGRPLPNHPCKLMLPSLEISSGSLGHGLGIGTGIAYSLKYHGRDSRVAVIMSDGECNEGSVWEAAAFGCSQKLDNLLAIVDNNNMQAVGRTNLLLGETSFEEKFKAFGWSARTVNGHDIGEIVATLKQFPFVKNKPSAIICKTTGGHGVSFMADQTLWHYRVPSAEDLSRALDELAEDPLYEAER
jgi:transketolase